MVSIIPALGSLRQDCHKFEASLSYIGEFQSSQNYKTDHDFKIKILKSTGCDDVLSVWEREDLKIFRAEYKSEASLGCIHSKTLSKKEI